MKTITEYQPLIFGSLLDQAAKRRCRRHQTFRTAALALPIVYVLAGLKITADTGLVVWDWRFWLMFVPLYLLGERVLAMLSALAGPSRG
jgi:hypothetical protein